MRKLLAVTLFLMLAVSAAVAQHTATTYSFHAGTIHPSPGLPGTFSLVDKTYQYKVVGYLGLSFHYVQYNLPDGTSAVLNNLKGGYTKITGSTNNPTYRFSGLASGIDSTGQAVAVSIHWRYHTVTRAGKGGGTTLVWEAGNLFLVK